MKKVPSEKGFLGLPQDEFPLAVKNQALIIPFGFEHYEQFGCFAAPQAIIAASKEINLFDERFGCYPYKQINITTLKEISPRKKADQALFQLQQWQEMLCQNRQFALTLGGETSLTLQAMVPWLRYNKDVVFIHFSAHSEILYDLAIQYPEQQFWGFGTRSVSESVYHLTQTANQRFRLYYVRDKHRWNWNEIKERLANKLVYLSVSMDCFDSSLFPATPYPEPGGFMWDEVMPCIECVATYSSIVGACLSNFSPMDEMPFYDLFVAKLAYRLLATIFLGSSAQ